jgi:hypothetical protein
MAGAAEPELTACRIRAQLPEFCGCSTLARPKRNFIWQKHNGPQPPVADCRAHMTPLQPSLVDQA